ncbi:hypothetical protein HK102_007057, partial [Quaeritorhiza haematococci]
ALLAFIPSHITSIIIPVRLALKDNQKRTANLNTLRTNVESFLLIFNDPALYKEFEAHAVRDLCIENLLFLSEYIQLQTKALKSFLSLHNSILAPSTIEKIVLAHQNKAIEKALRGKECTTKNESDLEKELHEGKARPAKNVGEAPWAYWGKAGGRGPVPPEVLSEENLVVWLGDVPIVEGDIEMFIEFFE